MTPFLALDTETSGLSPEHDQILELAMVAETGDWTTPVEQLPSKHYYVLHDRVTGHPEALAMNVEVLQELAVRLREKRDGVEVDHEVPAVRPDRLAGYVYEFCLFHFRGERANVAGKNVHFDLGFLAKLPHWNRELFSHRLIDVGNLWWHPDADRRLPDSEACAARAGLGVPGHRALADARDTVRMVRAWRACGVAGVPAAEKVA